MLFHDDVPTGARTGSSIAARDTGDRSGVFAAVGSTSWQYDFLFIALGGSYLAGWLMWIMSRIGRRREGDLVADAMRPYQRRTGADDQSTDQPTP